MNAERNLRQARASIAVLGPVVLILAGIYLILTGQTNGGMVLLIAGVVLGIVVSLFDVPRVKRFFARIGSTEIELAMYEPPKGFESVEKRAVERMEFDLKQKADAIEATVEESKLTSILDAYRTQLKHAEPVFDVGEGRFTEVFSTLPGETVEALRGEMLEMFGLGLRAGRGQHVAISNVRVWVKRDKDGKIIDSSVSWDES